MSNSEFEFQMAEADVIDDPKSWGLVSQFVVDHPQAGCARATYVRATIGYIPSLLMEVGEDTLMGKFATWLYKYLPFLIGAKVLMCTQCQQVVFVSRLMQRIYLPIAGVLGADKVKVLVCQYDTFNIPHEKKDDFFSPGA